MASTDQIVVLASGAALLFGGALLRITGAATEAAWLGVDMPASLRETCEDALRGSFAVMRVGAAAALLGLCMALSPLLGGAGALLGVIATGGSARHRSDAARARASPVERSGAGSSRPLAPSSRGTVVGDAPAWRRPGLVPFRAAGSRRWPRSGRWSAAYDFADVRVVA